MLDHHLKEKKCIIFSGKTEPWKVEASNAAKNCRNFIREIVDDLNLEPNPSKPVIALSIGDPTIYGNLGPSAEAVQAVVASAQEGAYNGYAACVGYESSRAAVADYLSHDGVEVKSKDVILCSGCSSALEYCITALVDPKKNHNILVPRPGFSIYRTLTEVIGATVKYYNLIPEDDWKIDLAHLESQIDGNTAAIILNNPSNPCGSVYTEEDLKNFLEVAHRYRIPVISDEVYEQVVFNGAKFISTASLNSGVPILICGGLTKRFLVPGWRLGWIVIHDEIGAFDSEIRKGLSSLSQRTIGSNTVVQGALAGILNTPKEFHNGLIAILENNAKIAYEALKEVKGLTPYMPQGAMYMMIELDFNKFPFENTKSFVARMMEEESVFCLPGECFQIDGFMRIVLTVPSALMEEACGRIAEFCNRHYNL